MHPFDGDWFTVSRKVLVSQSFTGIICSCRVEIVSSGGTLPGNKKATKCCFFILFFFIILPHSEIINKTLLKEQYHLFLVSLYE